MFGNQLRYKHKYTIVVAVDLIMGLHSLNYFWWLINWVMMIIDIEKNLTDAQPYLVLLCVLYIHNAPNTL